VAEGARLRDALAQIPEDELVALTRDLVRKHVAITELVDAARSYAASSLNCLKG
jgi:hypothetical protein